MPQPSEIAAQCVQVNLRPAPMRKAHVTTWRAGQGEGKGRSFTVPIANLQLAHHQLGDTPFFLMKTPIALTLMAATSLLAADKEKVFSGPQPGEKVTPFEVRVITSDGPGGKRDPIKAAGDGPLTLVFLHGLKGR